MAGDDHSLQGVQADTVGLIRSAVSLGIVLFIAGMAFLVLIAMKVF